MKKFKYQGAITKIISEKIALFQKKKFLKNIQHIAGNLTIDNKADFDVISFSGEESFEDQLLSICSFVYYAGMPVSWTVYSDKSYTTKQKSLFKKHFPFIEIVDWDVFDYVDNYTYLSAYLNFCHLAKKINVILGHDCKRQTIYIDSDVMLYKHALSYLNNAAVKEGLWYISDTLENYNCYTSTNDKNAYPLNSGFLMLNKNFNKQDVLDYFNSLKGDYHYFSEQSSFDYAFKKQGAHLLNPKEFVVDTSDQFDFASKYLPATIAMRHYVSPVRHKMWQNGWKWHFVQ